MVACILLAGWISLSTGHSLSDSFSVRTIGNVPVSDIESVKSSVRASSKMVLRFMGQPKVTPFEVVICGDRASFDKELAAEYLTPNAQRWMVGAGMRRGLCILNPSRWKTDAADHDPSNVAATKRLICHEIVHVYHAQINPSRDFDGMDDLGWLVEGVAVYASGQLDTEHKSDGQQAVRANAVPDKLGNFFGGRYGYGISGSLVAYIDHRYGHKTLLELLQMTKPDQVLGRLKTGESALITDWKSSLGARHD